MIPHLSLLAVSIPLMAGYWENNKGSTPDGVTRNVVRKMLVFSQNLTQQENPQHDVQHVYDWQRPDVHRLLLV